jgi:hypothetical protein
LINIEQLLKERLAPPSAVPAALILVIIPALLQGDVALIRVTVEGVSSGRCLPFAAAPVQGTG